MIELKENHHPLISHYLSILRDSSTEKDNFRNSLERISYLLASDVYLNLDITKRSIKTPLKKTTGYSIKSDVILLPVLRAGLGLLQGFIELYPLSKVSHIGLYRDEELLKPVKYYFKFPNLKNKENSKVIILDPMIATGGSVAFTVEYMLNMGMKDISVVSILCAPEGIKAIENRFGTKQHKYIKIFTCHIDEKLNDKGYILPGLGDAGDRLFGT